MFGLPELVIVLAIAATWLVPVAVAVWVIITLQHIRTVQDEMRRRLEAIEGTVQVHRVTPT